MSIREIAKLGNPILRKACKPVADPRSADTRKIVQDLFDTLADFRGQHGFGRGIAAPQIGRSVRILVINVDTPIAMINPLLMNRSKSVFSLWDDCFSFPELRVRVHRHKSITVRYTDLDGKRRHIDATEGMSELLQHELDHLRGILTLDGAFNRNSIVLTSEYHKRFAR